MLTFWAVLKASIFINKPLWSSFGQLLEILGDLIFRRLVTLQFRVTHLLVVINLLRRQSGLSISLTLLHLTLHFVSNFKVCNEATRWRSKAAFRRRLSQRNWRTAFFLLLGRGRLALGGRRARPRRLVRIWGHLRGGRFEKCANRGLLFIDFRLFLRCIAQDLNSNLWRELTSWPAW